MSAAEKGQKGSQEPEPVEKEQPKIMTKPLPEILDELENYIKRVEEAVRQARAAAKDAWEAAEQAKLSGKKAAEAAKEAADTAVAKVRDEAAQANEAVNARVTNLTASHVMIMNTSFQSESSKDWEYAWKVLVNHSIPQVQPGISHVE